MDDAYAAGILDGEGCLTVGLNRRGRFYDSRIDLGMTEKALGVLKMFSVRFGGRLRMSRAATDKWEAAWMWRVAGRGCLPILRAVLPHLVLKAQQARLLIQLEELKTGKRCSWTEGLRQKAAAIRATVMDLNRKGPPKPQTPPAPGAEFVRDVDGFLMQSRNPDLFDDSLWEPFSGPFAASGISEPGGCWMLNDSASPSEGEGCSGYSPVTLAAVLDPHAAPKYSLSPTACAGILRRAEKRGRDLPPALRAALEATAALLPPGTPVPDGEPDTGYPEQE